MEQETGIEPVTSSLGNLPSVLPPFAAFAKYQKIRAFSGSFANTAKREKRANAQNRVHFCG
jgi:hypothetical protein